MTGQAATAAPTIKPDPGVYPDVPMADYLSWPYASAGRLKDISRSPAHCAYRVANPEEPTEAMEVGTALHAAVLEPERFRQEYRLRPPGDGRTKAVKEARDDLVARGFKVLKEDAWDLCQVVPVAIDEHQVIRKLVKSVEAMEVSAVSLVDDIPVKVRADGLSRKASLIVDLKTTTDASPEAFRRQMYNLKYHWSAALYIDAFTALGIPIDYFVFLAVEKDPPFEIAAFTLSDAAIDIGRTEYRRALHTYAACDSSGVWPGYAPEIQALELPPWAYKATAEEVEA